MAKTYRPYVPEQDLLLPPGLRDWLPEGHLAFFVSDLVEQLDLSAILRVYEDDERGYRPYHPVMLTRVLVYGYCVGVFSSRRIQRRLVEDVAFRVLAAGNQPDFRTIADFRKRHTLRRCRASSSRCCGWPVSWARRALGGWRLMGARSRRTRRSTRR